MADNHREDRLQIVMKRVEDIAPYHKNPRRNERTVLKLKKSIEEFGFKNPIILDDNDVIVSGHARLKAAMMCGMEEVPCVYASGLSEDEIRAFRIADNKTAEIAGWDYDKLCEEMGSLFKIDFDLDLTGFNEAEQFYYGNPEATPEKVDKGEYKEYEEFAEEEMIQSFNVAITCENEGEKEYLKSLFKEDRNLKRLYRVEELRFLAAAAD